MNPPLRTEDDVSELRRSLVEGTIDAIATDHAPHPRRLKEQPFDQAPSGMLGVETSLAVINTALVQAGIIGLPRALAAMSWVPAKIASLHEQGQPIKPGSPANIAVFDPEARWVIEGERLASKSVNTPFEGWKAVGKVRHTICRGELVLEDGVITR